MRGAAPISSDAEKNVAVSTDIERNDRDGQVTPESSSAEEASTQEQVGRSAALMSVLVVVSRLTGFLRIVGPYIEPHIAVRTSKTSHPPDLGTCCKLTVFCRVDYLVINTVRASCRRQGLYRNRIYIYYRELLGYYFLFLLIAACQQQSRYRRYSQNF